MAGVINELQVDIVERISSPEEEAPPSPPPTKGDISDIDKDAMPSADEIRSAFIVVTPLDTLPPGTFFSFAESDATLDCRTHVDE